METIEYILIPILFIIFFVFPIFVTYRAYQNGYKGWALVTLITIFIGFGWLTGIFAYTKTKNPRTTGTPPNSYSVNGVGTMFFGASDRQPDGSFVTTQWFAFAGFPLVPIRSDRVKFIGEETRYFTTTNKYYDIIGPAPLDKKQILQIYGTLSLILLAGVFYLQAIYALGVLWILFMVQLIYRAK